MQSYRSILSQIRTEFTVERSRFIGTAAPVKTQEEAAEFIKRVAAEFPFATHNCYAYILGADSNTQKMSDDGEPQGTAGIPILEVLKRKKLTDVCVVVTRYFGGIKLGAGGLIGAYTRSASDVLDGAQVVEFKQTDFLTVSVDYTYYSKVSERLNAVGEILKTDFFSDVKISVAVPVGEVENLLVSLADITNGKAVTQKESYGFHSYKINNF